MTTPRWSAAALAAAAVLYCAGEATAQGRGGFRGGMPMTMMPMTTGMGTLHMTPSAHMSFGSAAGFRTHGFGRLTSPGLRGFRTVPGVTVAPQFATGSFATPQAFRGTPAAAQFRSTMRQFDAFEAAQLGVTRPTLAGTSWWSRWW